ALHDGKLMRYTKLVEALLVKERFLGRRAPTSRAADAVDILLGELSEQRQGCVNLCRAHLARSGDDGQEGMSDGRKDLVQRPGKLTRLPHVDGRQGGSVWILGAHL